MRPNNQEPIEDLFAFYALGTLSDDERELVEAYVERNPQAREQLGEMIEAATAMAFALDPIKPRKQLAESLLNRIRTAADESRDDEIVGRSRVSTWTKNWVTTALAVVSLLVATLSVSWAISRNTDILQLQSDMARLEATIAEQNEIILGISAPGIHAVDVPGTEEGSGASGRLFADPEGTSGVLFAWGLTPLSPEESYQVWLIAGDNPVSAGILSVGDFGNTAQIIEVDDSLNLFDAIGISIEPFGGSNLPTGPIVLFASLSD